MQGKIEMRQKIREKRKNVEGKAQKDAAILKGLEASAQFKGAKRVLVYWGIAEEVNTGVLAEKYLKEKEIILPRVEEKRLALHHLSSIEHLRRGKFDILEPHTDLPEVEASTVELAIVPGVAFDEKGHRLGFGGSFYDRLIKELNCPKIALAYECQIVKDVPREDHDQKVDMIITEERIIPTN